MKKRELASWYLTFSFSLNPRGWYRWSCYAGNGLILEAAILCFGVSLGWFWKQEELGGK